MARRGGTYTLTLCRTLDCASSQPAACSSPHSSDLGCSRLRLRVAQLQAVNKGPDDGETRLRVFAPLMRNDTILITRPGLDHLCSRVQKSSVQQDTTWSLAWAGVGFRVLELTRVHPYLQYLSESVMIPTFTKNGLLCFPFWTLAALSMRIFTGWLRKCIYFFPVFETFTSRWLQK